MLKALNPAPGQVKFIDEEGQHVHRYFTRTELAIIELVKEKASKVALEEFGESDVARAVDALIF